MRVACVGDNVVDRHLVIGRMFPGGNAVNVAVGASRAGAQAAYLGAVGTDVAGQCILSALAAEGVDTSRVRVVDGHTAYTDVYIVGGDRVFGDSGEGVSRLTLNEADYEHLSGFDMAHTGYAAMLEDQLPQIAERLPVSFDFAVEPIAYAEPLLPHVKVASFSASHLDPRDCERLLRDASELGPVVVVGSRGAWGVMLLHRSKVYAHRCVPIEPTDTLGAGDALIARILVGLLAEEAPERLLAEATEAATAACRHFGAFGHGVPLWPDGPKLSADVTRNHW